MCEGKSRARFDYDVTADKLQLKCDRGFQLDYNGPSDVIIASNRAKVICGKDGDWIPKVERFRCTSKFTGS